MSAPVAAQRLRLVQQRWPAAAQLARLLSLAVRIEPSLLRAARLAAGLDAAAEADLWFSGIIASSGTLGISFVPAVAEALRRELAASPGERALAWNLIREHHGQQPWSIRLEERINYLTTGPPAEASEIEDLLAAALSELHEVRARDEQAALGIARWLLAALARAPSAARATPAAAAAELAAGVHLGGRLGGADQLARAEDSELLPWLLDHLGTAVLPVRLLPGAVALGGDPPDGIALPVPATDPLVVSVIWGSGNGAHHEHVRVSPGEELEVPVEATEVELRTLAGGGVVLRRAGVGRIVVDGVDRGAGFAVADYAILTAAHVLGDWALHSDPAKDPAGSFASEAASSEVPAVEAESSEDAEAGSSASGPAPDVIYIPEDGEPLNVRVVATDSELDVVLLRPERPAPAILPVGQIQPGQKWRLQVLPGRGQTGSRQGVGAPAVSFGGVTTSGYPPEFALAPQRGGGPSLPGQSGAAITLENPWGAVIGLLLAETTQVVEIAEQREAGEAVLSGLQARLRAAPIDAIVASFNLARQITPATAALVDGKWPETQSLEDLVELPLRNGTLPVVADIEPTQLGFSPGPSARTITPTLQSALAASAFVLFVEEARVPSWEAYQAVRAELPDARLLVPNTRPGTLTALATHPDLAAYPERVVVWLDDLPRYLSESGGLDPFVLSLFQQQHHQTVLIGTISEADLDHLRSDVSQSGLNQQLLDQSIVISLMEEERNTASQVGPDLRAPGQDDEGRARAAAQESERLSNAGRTTDALASMQEAVGIYRSLTATSPERYLPDLGDSLSYLGVLLGDLGQHADALPVAEEAVKILRTVASANPSRYGPHLARSLSNLGMTLQQLGRFEEATAAQQEAVAIFRETGDRRSAGTALSGLGVTLRQLERFEEAIAAQQEAVAIFRETGDRHAEGTALINLGTTLQEAGRLEEAIATQQKAVDIYRETGDRQAEVATLKNIKAAQARRMR
jgi:tetratricopeptide (TPR) repeat protein